MITECKCPKCNELIEDYWNFNNTDEYYGNNEHWVTYQIRCDCGCRFAYTEIYTLTSAEIEIL